MSTFCIDITGSMSIKQIESAMDIVSCDWFYGDEIIVFDEFSMEKIHHEDVVDLSVNIRRINELQLSLFKRRFPANTRNVSGILKAFTQCVPSAKRVILTDGLIPQQYLSKFDRVVYL